MTLPSTSAQLAAECSRSSSLAALVCLIRRELLPPLLETAKRIEEDLRGGQNR